MSWPIVHDWHLTMRESQQVKLYKALVHSKCIAIAINAMGGSVLPAITILRKLCSHPASAFAPQKNTPISAFVATSLSSPSDCDLAQSLPGLILYLVVQDLVHSKEPQSEMDMLLQDAFPHDYKTGSCIHSGVCTCMCWQFETKAARIGHLHVSPTIAPTMLARQAHNNARSTLQCFTLKHRSSM